MLYFYSSVTRALEGLRSLREELAENSGVDTSLIGWLDSMFGKRKTLILSLLTGVIIGLCILALCGCCIVPCVRGLIVLAIDKSVSHQMIQMTQRTSLLSNFSSSDSDLERDEDDHV